MSETSDRLVEDYLKRLSASLSGLPRAQREEIVEEITEHIAASRATPGGDNELRVRELLDRLGDPEQIAADAQERPPAAAPRSRSQEMVAIVLLLVGGFLGGIGWLIGAILLWLSTVWTTRDKLIGTLLVPGGLALPAFLSVIALSRGMSQQGCISTVLPDGSTITNSCTQHGGTPTYERALWIALVVALVVASLLAAVYLARRSRSPAAA